MIRLGMMRLRCLASSRPFLAAGRLKASASADYCSLLVEQYY